LAAPLPQPEESMRIRRSIPGGRGRRARFEDGPGGQPHGEE